MTAPRRNNVAVIADLAPRTIAWLSIPLTPARAARLADFTARTGVDAQTLVVDLLDDMIFSLVECGGKASCTDHSAIPKSLPENCRDSSVPARTKLSPENSGLLRESSGLIKQQPTSRLLPEQMSAPQSAGSQANSSPPPSSSPPSSSRSPSGSECA